MGSTVAMGWAESVENGETSLYNAVLCHLTGNFYPPLPASMTKACVKAIQYANKGMWNKRVRLPEGTIYKEKYHTAPVSEIIDQHRLEFFLKDDSDEWLAGEDE
jgi:hypothetical protein